MTTKIFVPLSKTILFGRPLFTYNTPDNNKAYCYSYPKLLLQLQKKLPSQVSPKWQLNLKLLHLIINTCPRCGCG